MFNAYNNNVCVTCQNFKSLILTIVVPLVPLIPFLFLLIKKSIYMVLMKESAHVAHMAQA